MPRSASFAYCSTYSSEGVQPLCSSRVKNKEEKIRLYNKKNHGGQNRYNRFYASWAGIISWISVVTTISLSFDCFSIVVRLRKSVFRFSDFLFHFSIEFSVLTTISPGFDCSSIQIRVSKIQFILFFILNVVWYRLYRIVLSCCWFWL